MSPPWLNKVTIPYHTIPYHTIPYHTIPYHTIVMHMYKRNVAHVFLLEFVIVDQRGQLSK